MKELAFASIQTLQEHLSQRKISARELLQFFMQRFVQHDPILGTALEIFDEESILHLAQEAGSLYGIPGIIKDNICQKGRLLSCGSKILQNFSATYDATAVARLKAAGALLIGRANLDEFAMGSSTETSAFKKTKNPWNPSCVPGGSSGGSIAAVAGGLVPWALGSETGGSVRQPAAFCGIVGLKPTYGLISRYGLVAYASSLDQIGIATRTVYDNALLLEVLAGADPHDSSTIQKKASSYTQGLTKKVPEGLRIGILKNALYAQGIDPEVVTTIEQAVAHLQTLGATVQDVSLPIMDFGAAIYFILSRAEAASNLARFDGVRYGLRHKADSLGDMYELTRQEGFGSEVKSRIIVGNYVLSAGHAAQFYTKAKIAQNTMRQEFENIFKTVDVLLAPTTPSTAFKLGAFDNDKLQMDLQDYFTCPMNIAGIPALSIPCGFSKQNMPIGMQIIGPHESEALLYQVAYAYEQSTDWHTKVPPAFA